MVSEIIMVMSFFLVMWTKTRPLYVTTCVQTYRHKYMTGYDFYGVCNYNNYFEPCTIPSYVDFFLNKTKLHFWCLKHQEVVRSGSSSLSLLPYKVTGSIPWGGIQYLLLMVKVSSPILVTDMLPALNSQTRTEWRILIFIYNYNKKV